MTTLKQRPTIIDIAKQADVSFKTVSRVLNDNPGVASALRTRVLKAMSDLDYRPNLAARALAGRRGFTIALMVEQAEFFPEHGVSAYCAPYLVELQAGALIACRAAGYHFFLQPYDASSPDFPHDLRAQMSKLALDGVVLAPPTADRRELLDALDEWDVPYVRISPGIEVARSPSVAVDEYRATSAIAEHLLALGHRRIAIVAGPDNHISATARLTAFRQAVGRRAELLVHPSDFTFTGGVAAGNALLGRPGGPTAIFAVNDFMAAGVIVAATGLGLTVPRDVSVIGYDDSTIATLTWPPLTTVRQPTRAMAKAAIEQLVARASGQELATEQAEIPFVLIERKSTGAAP